MNVNPLFRLVASFALTILAVRAEADPQVGFEHFITRKADQLMDGDQEWRSIGVNIPGLVYSHDGYMPSLPTAWEQEDAFKSMRQMGVTSVRVFMPSVRKPYSEPDSVERHVLGPGQFNEKAFRGFDKILELANRYQIRVIISFVDNHSMYYGGYQNYTAFRHKAADLFWTDPQLISDFKKTVEYMILRKNHYTGVIWKDDPAILCWEFGNELEPSHPGIDGWTKDMAAFIKQLDPRHLVMDGSDTRAVPGIRPAALEDPNIDILSPHYYFKLTGRVDRDLTRGKKALIVGEFGNAPAAEIQSFLDRVIADGTSGAMLWAMYYHREGGGFKRHTLNGPFGDSRTVNWPGFNDGSAFDERERLAAVRAAAYKIRGLVPPAPEIPEPPLLLPLPLTLPWQKPGQLALFTWRGSAGATGYRLERALRAEGPFEVVGDNLPDGHVFYQPLATDSSAELNREYFYRLRALTAAGASDPSPVLGPVVFREKLLIDDLRDFSLVDQHSPDIEIRSKAPQPYYEDYHRVHRKEGSSEVQSITYQIKSDNLVTFRVTAFGDQDPRFEVSRDGQSFRPVERVACEVTPGYVSLWNGEGDYIQTRTIYRPANPLPDHTHFLRIRFETTVIGRVEIGHRP